MTSQVGSRYIENVQNVIGDKITENIDELDLSDEEVIRNV